MLAQRERRTVAAVVEAALDRYAAQTAIAEPITDFLARLQEGKTAADDLALDRVMSAIAAEQKPQPELMCDPSGYERDFRGHARTA